jgi:hypothetical protein
MTQLISVLHQGKRGFLRATLAVGVIAATLGAGETVSASNPSGSRLAPHLLLNYTSGCQQMIQAHPRVIKILDTGGGMLAAMREYKAGTPGGKVVFRAYTSKGYSVSQDPATCASDFWNTVLAPPLNALSPSDRALIDYVEGPNEQDSTPTWGSVADAQWYNTFWVNLAPLIGNAGFKPCSFSISVGNPPGDPAYMNTMIDTIVPALRACKQYNGAWGYHSYTIVYTQDVNTELWYSLRYRQYYQRFAQYYPDLNDLTLILTEGGVDGQSGSGGPGWKIDTATRYQNWLAWFDARLMEDSYVLGCTLFQSGDTGSWNSFELEPVSGWIANRLATTNPPGPTISLSPTALNPAVIQGGNAANQTFTVANSGTGALSYTISDNATWLAVSPTSGTSTGAANTHTVTYATSGLAVGTYTGTITVTDPYASNNPQTVTVTLTVSAPATTISEDFETLPAWSSTFDASWGNAATFSAVSGGQSGNCMQAQRSGSGSSVKAKVYTVTANTTYTVSIWIRCPSSSSYWAETAYKLGSNTAQDFDQNAGTWTLIKKFDNAGTNGNGDIWTRYAVSVATGSSTQLTIGYKLGSSPGNGPIVKWDMLRIAPPGALPTISRSPASLSPTCNQGSNASSQSFTVQNTGAATLSYSISDNQTWLSVSPTTGTSTGGINTHTVTYATSGLAAGTYAATITITDAYATNNPQTISVALTVNAGGTTVSEDFTSMPSWTSSFDAAWGNAAAWSIVAGGQSGNALQAQRTNVGSSVKAKVYSISANTNYTISVYIKCPSGSAYWSECAYKLGSATAQDFDQNGGTWTMIQKFASDGTNGNGNTWVQYSKTFSSGSSTQISVGFKLGSSSGTGPTVIWDTLRVQ